MAFTLTIAVTEKTATVSGQDLSYGDFQWDEGGDDTGSRMRFTLVEGSLDTTGTEVNDAYIQLSGVDADVEAYIDSITLANGEVVNIKKGDTVLATAICRADYDNTNKRILIKKLYAGATESGNTTLASLDDILEDTFEYELVAHNQTQTFSPVGQAAAKKRAEDAIKHVMTHLQQKGWFTSYTIS